MVVGRCGWVCVKVLADTVAEPSIQHVNAVDVLAHAVLGHRERDRRRLVLVESGGFDVLSGDVIGDVLGVAPIASHPLPKHGDDVLGFRAKVHPRGAVQFLEALDGGFDVLSLHFLFFLFAEGLFPADVQTIALHTG